MPPSTLPACADDVRRQDNDRFLTCLFAPAGRREALFAVLAFNLEIARTRELVREPLMGQVRLQWWRDVVDRLYSGSGPLSEHTVLEPLAGAITVHRLSRHHFDTLIDARESDLDGEAPATLADLTAYAEATSAPLVLLALEVLGTIDAVTAEAGRHVGIAWALTGLLRAVPFHLRHRRVTLPADLLGRHGLSAVRLLDWRPDPRALAPAVAEVAAAARHHLAAARRLASEVPAAALPALLPATLADLYLDSLERSGWDVFSPRVQQRHPLRPLLLAWRVWRGRY